MKNKRTVLWIALMVMALVLQGCSKKAEAQGQQFNSASDFMFIELTDRIVIERYIGKKTVVNIPPTIKNKPVVVIREDAFGNTEITSITIPDSVTDIQHHAFAGCKSLTNITIPDSVTFISQGTFLNCSSLSSVTIGNGIGQIGESAFMSCENLTSITIPKKVFFIGKWAFYGCTNLTSVTFEEGGKITADNFDKDVPFPGNLRSRYLSGGAGTYTTTAPTDSFSSVWTKQ